MDPICANCGADIEYNETFCSSGCAAEYRDANALENRNDLENDAPQRPSRVQKDVTMDTAWAESRNRY